MKYTTDYLINRIKRSGALSFNQPSFTDTVLLEMLDEEFQNVITPFMISLCEGYLIKSIDQTVVADQTVYIPANALGSALKEVKIIDGTNVINLPIGTIGNKTAMPHFVLLGNKIELINCDTYINKTLRLYYYSRPNTFVFEEDCGKIESIDTVLNSVTCEVLPDTFTDSLTYDIIRHEPQFDKLFDNKGATIVDDTMTFATTLDTNISVGDYVSIKGETCVPELPIELHSMLCQSVVVRIMESMNDKESYQFAKNRLEELKDDAKKLISPRVKSERKTIVNKHGLF